MHTEIQHITICDFETKGNKCFPKITQSYQVFGCPLHSAPIVLVHHALTGNSNVAHPDTGWWRTLIGPHKTINTLEYTVITFNILGNGYDGVLLEDHHTFNAADIAQLQYLALQQLGIHQVHTIIGGSVGGGIAWEMVVSHPAFAQHLIPIASAWKSSNWIKGQTHVQESILAHSSHPLVDARMMAMLFYRTPASFDRKFSNPENPGVTSWLDYHGKSLLERFDVQAYRTINHVLAHIDVTQHPSFTENIQKLGCTVIQVAIDSDIYFHKEANLQTKEILDAHGITNAYHEIKSIHGHDAFLIEYDQLAQILTPHFTT